jgi:micrococcal nuclease
LTLLEILLPVATVFWSWYTAVVGPVEVIPVPKRLWEQSANYDGDTIQLKVDEGVVVLVFTVRVEELDTPEIKGACPEERRLADLAKRATRDFLSRGPIFMTHVSPGLEKQNYGRVLAKIAVRFPSGELKDLAEYLKADPRGIARGYDVDKGRQPWCPPVVVPAK